MRLSIPIQVVVLAALACHGCAAPGNRMKAGASAPKLSENEIQLDRVLSLARLHERQKKTGDAIKLYESVLERDPQNSLAHHRLGVISAAHGEFDDAHQHFAVAMSSGKPSAELLNDVGYVHYLQSDYPNAEARFREALKADIQSKQARVNLGLALGFQQRFDESFEQFQRAGSEAEAYNNLAFVQSQLGFVDQAVASYHRSLDLNPKQRSAAEALVQLTKAQAKEQAVASARTSQPPSNVAANTQVAAAPVPAARTEMEPRRTSEFQLTSYASPATSGARSTPQNATQATMMQQTVSPPPVVLPPKTAAAPEQTAAVVKAAPSNPTPPAGLFMPVMTGQAGNGKPAAPPSNPANTAGVAPVQVGETVALPANVASARPAMLGASPTNVNSFSAEANKPLPAGSRPLPAWVPMNLSPQTTSPVTTTRTEATPGGTLAPVVTPDFVRRTQIPVPVATPDEYWSTR